MNRLAFPCIALVLAAACAAVDRTAPASEASPAIAGVSATRSHAEDLVAYLARLRTLNESALAGEAARQKRDTSDVGRIKAAMALSLAPQAEESDILALLDPVLKKDGGDRDAKAMASFLHNLTLERRRLRESAATAGAKMREERRTAEAQKQRADALQQKLDALTELEKSLSDRSTSQSR
jgi:hypothetical protein